MKCPDCGEELKEVFTTSHYGAKVVLDQCFSCGGIWFDNFELYPIPKKEIQKIEKIDVAKLQENSFLGKGNNLCPKCSSKLEIFKDYNFPKQLEAEYCQNCNGLWMNRGEATDFKSWQGKKVVKNNKLLIEEDKKFQEEIKSILAFHKSDNFDTLGNIGKALTQRSIKNGDHVKEETKEQEAVSIVIGIISMLIRLFLKC